MVDRRDCVPIPGPPGLPLLGNILDIAGEVPLDKLTALGRKYGEIFAVDVLGRKNCFVSTQALANEICDEKRFTKIVQSALFELRAGVHDGLFTAQWGEPSWEVAHRVLAPAFGPLAINAMFPDMKDIASQLVLKWARYGEDYKISAPEDFTRLTMDTLAICAMGYRFNSFYNETLHPFIDEMVQFLSFAGVKAKTPHFLRPLMRREEAKFEKSIEYMRGLSDKIVQERKSHPKESPDLLNFMLQGKDSKTGKKMTDGSITDNIITLLIAGHETTSGMLSFTMQYLLKNSGAYRKVQEEVDTVVGTESVTLDHLAKLPYINACLREASRLMASAPFFSLTPKSTEGEVIGGKYFIAHGQTVVMSLHGIHRDPEIYGEDAEEFKPERMLDENFEKYPPNSWKVFGNGSRACLGKPFAWQEMLLTMVMLFQFFEFSLDDPDYDLHLVYSLTIKPKDFYIRAKLREGYTATIVEQMIGGDKKFKKPQTKSQQSAASAQSDLKPMTILFGSNSGTCEAFANTLAADAALHGFTPSKVGSLDDATNNIPTDQPVVVITASYEGEPTDDAGQFWKWLQKVTPDDGVKPQFAVFGCGHSDWKSTLHLVPKGIDALFEKSGGERLCKMGTADAAKGDMMSDFQAWEDEALWPALAEKFGGASDGTERRGSIAINTNSVSVEVTSKRATVLLRSDVSGAKVLLNKTITSDDVIGGTKKHIEMSLPSGMTYRAGDYCAVLPVNPPETVHRVLSRFGLPWDATLTLSSMTGTSLPTDEPISAQDLFGSYLEIAQPATKRNLSMLIDASTDGAIKKELQDILDGDFTGAIVEKRVSLLDLLERYASIELPLGSFISSLMAMRIRQYSISSSPLGNPGKLVLTYAVLDAPSLSGQGRHVGVASNYLSSLRPGDVVHVAIKQSHASFHLPETPETTPVIMIAAGTGMAPMRAFVQERAAMISAGRKLAPAHFYFGCRHPDQDDLYHDQMNIWEKMGAVTVHRAYSRIPEKSNGHKYVDAAMIADKKNLVELWDQGAMVYVCGSRGLGESVKQACFKIQKEQAKALGRDESNERSEAWFDGIRNDRFTTDVFA